jgi:hypothetical protein
LEVFWKTRPSDEVEKLLLKKKYTYNVYMW